MNECRTLFENFWICKDTDKETYYKVKRDIPNFQNLSESSWDGSWFIQRTY